MNKVQDFLLVQTYVEMMIVQRNVVHETNCSEFLTKYIHTLKHT